jgi:hypothetical protein
MPATRMLTHSVVTIIVCAVAALTATTVPLAGSSKKTPPTAPIVSGWNIDLVDIVEAGQVYSATVSDPYVYAAFGRVLIVLDVSNAGDPIRVGVATLPNVCEDMEVSGTYLYCYCAQSGVQVVDVSDPSAPNIVGSVAASGDLIDIDGDRLYIKNLSKLEVYDLANPAVPAFLGASVFNIGFEFEAQDGYVYSAESSAGLRIIDATNPATPVLAGSVPIGLGAYDVDVAWPYAFAVSPAPSGGGLYIIDVSNPVSPFQAAYSPSGPYPADSFEEIVVNGNTAYVAGGTAPLSIFDISNPAAPIRLPSVVVCPGSFDTGIGFSGRLAVLKSDLSICVMDCSNPTFPVPLAFYEALPNINGLALSPTHLVMPTARGGLAMVNQNDTQQRSFYSGSLTEEWNTFEVAVKDDYAYVNNCWIVGGSGLMLVFDISDPANPSEAGLFGMSMCPVGCVNLGPNHAYLTTFDKLISVDISDPTTPELEGQVTVPLLRAIAVAEPYLYALGSSAGLVVFDVSNPATPTSVGTGLSEAALGGHPLDIAISSGHAYVVMSGPVGGMRVVDVANPLAPAMVGNLEILTPNFGSGRITVRNSFVYFSGTDGVLRVADASDPTNPLEVANIPVGGLSSELRLAPPFLYALGAGGHILKFESDLITDVNAPTHSPFVLGQNYPNPFNPSTSISFELPSPSHAVIEIFDVRGSLVRTLADETMSAGGHTVEWNGRDDDGSVVGSGLYFYRLTAGGHSQAKKMVILK